MSIALIKVSNTVTSVLLATLYCSLNLFTVMKQTAMLKRATWQEAKGCCNSLSRLPEQNTTIWVPYRTENCFLTVLETASLRSRWHHVWFLVRPLFLGWKCRHLTAFSHGLSSVYICREIPLAPLFLLIRTLILLDYGPILMTSLNLNYLLKSPFSNAYWVRVTMYEFDGDTIQPLTVASGQEPVRICGCQFNSEWRTECHQQQRSGLGSQSFPSWAIMGDHRPRADSLAAG